MTNQFHRSLSPATFGFGGCAMQAKLGLAVGATLLLVTSGANAATLIPSLAATSVTGGVIACGPCGGGGSQVSASQNSVPLDQFGTNYAISGVPSSLAQSNVNTPGTLTVSIAGTTSAVSVIGGADPSINASITGSRVLNSQGQYSYGQNLGSSFGSFFEVVNPTSSSGSATVYVTAKGGVSVTSQATPGSFAEGNSGYAVAQLFISGLLNVSATANYEYSDLPNGEDQFNANSSNVTGTAGSTSSFSGGFNITNDPITVQLNTPYEIQLNTETGGGPIVNASAYVDPIITSPGNNVYFSSGITGAVPEPSTWAMMLLGFAGVGFMAYRRKPKLTPMAA